MRRVLFVTHTGWLSSGGEISNYQLMGYLRSAGVDVELIYPDWGSEQYVKSMQKIGVKAHALKYTHWAEEDSEYKHVNLRALGEICKIARKFNPDVIVTNTSVIPWGAAAAALLNKPHIWAVREFPLGEHAYLKEKMGYIHGFSNAVMANSKQLSTYISEAYHFPVGQFYSYVDIEGIDLNNDITDTRLVSPNGIYARKNQLELIQALSILKKRNKNFVTKVVLIGSKEETYWQSISELIKVEQLEELIEWHDFTDNPWSLVGKNDILVQTSLSESIGRTTTEAMKLGVPVIASNIPGHVEAFELGGGTLYISGDPNDLADKIENALKDRAKLQRVTKKIQNKVKRTMSEDSCSGPFLDVLKSLVGKENPRKELEQLNPYIESYIDACEKELAMLRETILSQEQSMTAKDAAIGSRELEIGQLQQEIVDIKNSRAYKVGLMQASMLNKVRHSVRRMRMKK